MRASWRMRGCCCTRTRPKADRTGPIRGRIAEAVRVSVGTIERVRQRFVEEGLEAALLPRPSPRVYTRKLDGEQEAKLVAVACSEPPEGKKRWMLRLLANGWWNWRSCPN